jgi:hypothetical protein
VRKCQCNAPTVRAESPLILGSRQIIELNYHRFFTAVIFVVFDEGARTTRIECSLTHEVSHFSAGRFLGIRWLSPAPKDTS